MIVWCVRSDTILLRSVIILVRNVIILHCLIGHPAFSCWPWHRPRDDAAGVAGSSGDRFPSREAAGVL